LVGPREKEKTHVQCPLPRKGDARGRRGNTVLFNISQKVGKKLRGGRSAKHLQGARELEKKL